MARAVIHHTRATKQGLLCAGASGKQADTPRPGLRIRRRGSPGRCIELTVPGGERAGQRLAAVRPSVTPADSLCRSPARLATPLRRAGRRDRFPEVVALETDAPAPRVRRMRIPLGQAASIQLAVRVRPWPVRCAHHDAASLQPTAFDRVDRPPGVVGLVDRGAFARAGQRRPVGRGARRPPRGADLVRALGDDIRLHAQAARRAVPALSYLARPGVELPLGVRRGPPRGRAF